MEEDAVSIVFTQEEIGTEILKMSVSVLVWQGSLVEFCNDPFHGSIERTMTNNESILDPVVDGDGIVSGLISPVSLIFAFLDGFDGATKDRRCESTGD